MVNEYLDPLPLRYTDSFIALRSDYKNNWKEKNKYWFLLQPTNQIDFLIPSEGKHYCDTKFKINSLLKAAEMYFYGIFDCVRCQQQGVIWQHGGTRMCLFF